MKYLRVLLNDPRVRDAGKTLWVMAGPESAAKNLAWLETQGISVPTECVYNAPMYGNEIQDPYLVSLIERLQVSHVILTIGGGTQERLGFYLKQNLRYLPAIHCIGAAIAFLSGDQVRIPGWADKFYLGWLFRCISSPSRYIPRYWSAIRLVSLMWRYRDQLPPRQDLALPGAR